jgi:ubiquitin carboxyl-terminal hydrolase 7
MEEISEPANPANSLYNSKKMTNMVGLENLGATCYLNALLQMLYHISAFRKAVYILPHDNENLETSTTLALQNIFKNLQCGNTAVTTKDLTKSFGWSGTDTYLQQDVQEMMRVLLEKLEMKMKGTMVEGVIGDLFAGNICSYIRCLDVEYESRREEEFYDIQLDVKGCSNIYDSFRKYTKKEVLDGENKYDAGPEFKKQKAEKGVIFTKFPPVLTVHLKRFDFSLQRMGSTKINDKFEFPARLDLDEVYIYIYIYIYV